MSEREPTDAEMVHWLGSFAALSDARAEFLRETGGRESFAEVHDADAAMLRAIARRLRQSAGKAEPGPTWQGEDAT